MASTQPRDTTMKKLTVYTAKCSRTMDPGRPEATAIAVAGERIVSVGSLDSMKPWLDRFPRDIDDRFANDVLMPGFVDPHMHLRVSGIFMGLNYVGPIPSYGAPGPARPPHAALRWGRAPRESA